jgi:hypothetical protein
MSETRPKPSYALKYIDPPPEIAALDFTGLMNAIPKAHSDYEKSKYSARRWKAYAGGIWVIADLRRHWTQRLYTSTWGVRGLFSGEGFDVTSFGGSVEDCQRDFVMLRVCL